jgi:hypothetical protein
MRLTSSRTSWGGLVDGTPGKRSPLNTSLTRPWLVSTAAAIWCWNSDVLALSHLIQPACSAVSVRRGIFLLPSRPSGPFLLNIQLLARIRAAG